MKTNLKQRINVSSLQFLKQRVEYLRNMCVGLKNPKAREAEIKRTAKLYREGKLTPAMMKKIDRDRRKG